MTSANTFSKYLKVHDFCSKVVLREERRLYTHPKRICSDGCLDVTPLIWGPERTEMKWVDNWTKSSYVISNSIIMAQVEFWEWTGWGGVHHAGEIWKTVVEFLGSRPNDLIFTETCC